MSRAPFRQLLGRLGHDERGSVMIEFAMWTTLLFIGLMVALDFAGYYIARGTINKAISAGAVIAFQDREDTDFTQLAADVRNLAEDQSLGVDMICNGVTGACTNTSRTCACLKSDATYVASTCGNVCTGSGMTANSVAGYYLTIRASQTYQPLLVPDGMLSGMALNQATTVRLQ